MELSPDTLARVRDLFDKHYTRCPICGSHRVCFHTTLYDFAPFGNGAPPAPSDNGAEHVPAIPITCKDCSFLFWMKIDETPEPYEVIADSPW